MNNKRVLGSSLIALVIALGGCGGWKMMPSPIAYRDGGVDPFTDVAPDDRTTTVDVLYATDRARTISTTPAKWYGERRGLALELGTMTVRIGGKGDSWADLERASERGKRPTMRIVEGESFGTLWTTIPISDAENFEAAQASTSDADPVRAPARRFIDEVNERLARSDWKEVVIYVPGFNTPFKAPVHMMAQYAHYMGRDGVFIAYSWPARSSPLGYSKQMTTAGISVRNLRQLVLLLAEHSDAHQINLVSYSAGAPILTDALLQLRLMHADDTEEELRRALPIGSVVYAGADEDLDYYRNTYLDGFGQVAENITVYTSRADFGVTLSRLFTTGSARLGNVTADLTEGDLAALRQGTTTHFVDVTDASRAAGGGDIWSHGYWYLNPWINQDVIVLLRTNAPPADRGLVREEGEAIWSIPRDYPRRVGPIAGRALR